jgi:DinB superfamily
MKHHRDTLIADMQNQTETILQKVISNWQLIPHSRFAQKTSPATWSANECLQHLNSYGRYYLPAIERALNAQKNSNSSSEQFSPGWLGGYFTKTTQPLPDGKLPMKMKSPSDHTPKTILESHIVISEFIDQQEKLLQLLTKAKHADLNERSIGITIAPFIKLKLGDVLMFMIAHITRHTRQAEQAMHG